MNTDLPPDIATVVTLALAEDIGTGDITAELIAADTDASARVISREGAVICGRPWFDEVFATISPSITIQWHVNEGERVAPDQLLCELRGPARALLTGERCALNFLQTLSGTATVAARYAEAVAGTSVQILDTRKTLPGLRTAQKYAIRTGGCHNHRIGLFDAFLIKENHIAACGGISATVARARELHPDKPVEVEVESIEELSQALEAGADTIMLDNFSVETISEAVAITAGRAKLEVSGNVSLERLPELAATGIDFISVGGLTKHVRAVDLSMRVDSQSV